MHDQCMRNSFSDHMDHHPDAATLSPAMQLPLKTTAKPQLLTHTQHTLFVSLYVHDAIPKTASSPLCPGS